MQQDPRSLRLVSVGLGLALLLVLVAFGSRTGVGHTSTASPTPGYVSWAMSVFLVLFVCAIPWAVYVYILQAREVASRNERKSYQARVARSLMFIGLFAILGLVKIWFGSKIHFSFGGRNQITPPPNAVGHDGRPKVIPQNPTFQWPVLWGFFVLFAAGIALWWFKLRHRAAAPLQEEEATFQEQIVASIDDALDDLAAEPDARRAVIAAYARMEQAFARHGLRRRESETPVEYLRRILLGLTSRSEAVRRLTDLFEQAKFSHHEIDGGMKDEAIDALRAIRDDLQLAPA